MKEKILSLIEQGKYFDARNEICNLNVVDAAQLFEEVEQKHILLVFRILPKDFSSEVFSYMSFDLQKHVIDSMTDEEAFKAILKKEGYLTRDSRMKERKKYGLKKARKASQFSKR